MGAFTIVPGAFVNGSFELGDPNDDTDMPGWKFLIDRPGPVMLKQSSAGGLFGGIGYPFDGTYYGGNTYGGNGDFQVALAQSFKTTPGTVYSVSGGYFGGAVIDPPTGGTNGLAWWETLVVDGTTQDMNSAGTTIAKIERPQGGDYIAFRETFTGQFTAGGTTATIFLKWGDANGTYAYHLAGWDALVIAPMCHTPWADADGDGDVDQDDFGAFQRCFTGDVALLASTDAGYPCQCFDRDATPDGHVDAGDMAQFLNCMTGPTVKFDVDNPPPGCTP